MRISIPDLGIRKVWSPQTSQKDVTNTAKWINKWQWRENPQLISYLQYSRSIWLCVKPVSDWIEWRSSGWSWWDDRLLPIVSIQKNTGTHSKKSRRKIRGRTRLHISAPVPLKKGLLRFCNTSRNLWLSPPAIMSEILFTPLNNPEASEHNEFIIFTLSTETALEVICFDRVNNKRSAILPVCRNI